MRPLSRPSLADIAPVTYMVYGVRYALCSMADYLSLDPLPEPFSQGQALRPLPALCFTLCFIPHNGAGFATSPLRWEGRSHAECRPLPSGKLILHTLHLILYAACLILGGEESCRRYCVLYTSRFVLRFCTSAPGTRPLVPDMRQLA